MKTKGLILTLLALVISFSLFSCTENSNDNENDPPIAEINSENFPDALMMEKAKAADTDKNGTLTQKEIESVKKLSVKKLLDEKGDTEDGPYPEYTIEDFTIDLEGIQYFSALTELTVNMTGGEIFVKGEPNEIYAKTENFEKIYECKNLEKISLYEINVSELRLEKFSKLRRLDLSFMYELEKLDAANGKNITFLWISDCPELCELDLSGMSKLKTLNTVYNDNLSSIVFDSSNEKLSSIQLNGLKSLNSIDVTPLLALKDLNIIDVALSSDIDLSKNIKLDSICAEGLKLNTLDLSNNPSVTYIINGKDSFKNVILSDNNIVSMLRWTDSEVTSLPVTNLNPETLTGLDIQGTKIKKIDVSMYPNLDTLYYDEDFTEIVK